MDVIIYPCPNLKGLAKPALKLGLHPIGLRRCIYLSTP